MRRDGVEVLDALRARGLKTRFDPSQAGAWDADCAGCHPRSAGLWPLRITERYPGDVVRLTCANGCSEQAIFNALGLHAGPLAVVPEPAPLAPVEGWSALGAGLERWDLPALLDGPLEPPPWLADGVLAYGHLTLLSGREGLGKTAFANALASAISRGRAVAGIECRRGRVLVLDAENDRWIVKHRLLAFDPDLSAFEHISVEQGVFSLARQLGDVEAMVVRHRADAVMFDSFATLAGPTLEENNAASVIAALGPLGEMLQRQNCAGLLLHHAAKANDGEGFRGSTAIPANASLRHTLTASGDRLTLTCRKCRLAPTPGPWHMRQSTTPSGLMVLEAADPPRRGQVEADTVEQLARRLGEHAAMAGKVSKGELCAALGIKPNDGSTGRAFKRALEAGYLVKVSHGVYAAGPNAGGSSIHPPAEGGEGGWMNPDEGQEAAA